MMKKPVQCRDCGRVADARGDTIVITHWLGCKAKKVVTLDERAPDPPSRAVGAPEVMDEAHVFTEEQVTELAEIVKANRCEHGECPNPRRPQGKGPKPKYCDDHRTAKSRKEK